MFQSIEEVAFDALRMFRQHGLPSRMKLEAAKRRRMEFLMTTAWLYLEPMMQNLIVIGKMKMEKKKMMMMIGFYERHLV